MHLDVCFMQNRHIGYPTWKYSYSPAEKHPEYPFDDVAGEDNEVYEAIRNSFIAMEMDQAHFNTQEWNPLGDIITQGQTVLLKPNWVQHYNQEPEFNNMECVVTNPSIIRTVIDYVYIALKGSGRIIIADAPMQKCDLDMLHCNMHYNAVWEYYRKKNINIEIMDLRGMIVKEKKDGTFEAVLNQDDGVVVDLEKKSCFYGMQETELARLRITRYPIHFMQKHHLKDKHDYMINPIVLQADVIINLPKPKSHRKAGLTACSKNLVGVNMRKEYLPHYMTGSKADGGDEYLHKNYLFMISSKLIDKFNNAEYAGKRYARLYRFFYRVFKILGNIGKREEYSEGSWYGNDTIWRTIVDLNRIVEYANKDGLLEPNPQRKIFNICDMIIAGEKEGPLEPSPKPLGIIVMGMNIPVMDWFICSLVGFDADKVHYVNYMLDEQGIKTDEIIIVKSNKEKFLASQFEFKKEWHLEPTKGWKGHIEIDFTNKKELHR